MEKKTVAELSCELVKAVGKSLSAFFKSILYHICRYESGSDRTARIQAMQALLDAEHGCLIGNV